MPKNTIRAILTTALALCASTTAYADDTFFEWDYADLCASNTGEWNECAPVTINVPAGETVTVEIETTASFYENDVSQSVLACIGVRPSSQVAPAACSFEAEAGTDLDVAPATVNDDLESVSTSLLRTLSPGTYVISSLVAPQDDTLDIEPLNDVGKVRTKVRVICDDDCGVTETVTAMLRSRADEDVRAGRN